MFEFAAFLKSAFMPHSGKMQTRTNENTKPWMADGAEQFQKIYRNERFGEFIEY